LIARNIAAALVASSSATDHHDPQPAIIRRAPCPVGKLRDHLIIERIAHVGPVERDVLYGAVAANGKELVGHIGSPRRHAGRLIIRSPVH
jgi:hypothetical protein